MMKAVGYLQSLPIDHPEALLDIELPQPTPGPHDLLVKVQAVSVNPVDTKVRKRSAPPVGSYKVLGWDACGTVAAVGAKVTHFKVGDAVWYAGDITRQGSNAEYQVVDERIVGPKPETLSFAEAAALPLTGLTAWELLFDRLQVPKEPVRPDDTILVVGAAGGVGSIMIQLIRQLTGYRVAATASRPESREWVKSLGAEIVINHNRPLARELEVAGIANVPYAVCLNQTDQHFSEIVTALRPQGRFGLIDDPQQLLDIRQLKLKSLSLHWELMFTRSMFQTPDMLRQREILTELSTLVDAGKIRTTLQEKLGFINATNLRRAHTRLEAHEARGKMVLEGF